jgi:hypothetical protein
MSDPVFFDMIYHIEHEVIYILVLDMAHLPWVDHPFVLITVILKEGSFGLFP